MQRPNPIESPVDLTMPEAERKPRIALGADHAGYHAKETIKQFLTQAGYQADDVGTWSEESVDYPVYVRAVGQKVRSGQDQLSILACGTGIGVVNDPGALEIVRDFLSALRRRAPPTAHRRDCGTRPGTGAEVTSATAVRR
jgi:Ribose/Galactose Isomerase